MSRGGFIVLLALSFTVAGCGTINIKPSGVSSAGVPASRGRVDAPATHKPDHVACLRAHGLPVRVVEPTRLVIAGVVRVTFTPTPGSAQDFQIENRTQGAEVIGSALLYPGQVPDSELTTIENCLASGVKG